LNYRLSIEEQELIKVKLASTKKKTSLLEILFKHKDNPIFNEACNLRLNYFKYKQLIKEKE